MWMLMVMVHSLLSLDAMKPVQTYYQTQTECQAAMEGQLEKGNYGAFCAKVTWQ